MNPQITTLLRSSRRLIAAAAGLIASLAFAGVTVTQNVSPGATAWPGAPIVSTVTNPSAQLTVGESFGGATSYTETFTISAANAYTLQRINLYVGGGTGTSATSKITLNLFDLGARVAPNPNSYAAGVNLLGAGNGLPISYVSQGNGVIQLDFDGADQAYLAAGHMYAFEIAGNSGTTPMNWLRTISDTYSGGAAYRNRSWINGTNARDFGLAVYGVVNTAPPPPTSCTVNGGTTFQQIDGFGAGAVFLDAGLDPLTDSQMDALYGTADNQMALTLIRLRISPYGSGDWQTAALDGQKAHARGARILATPWTPPAAMKDNNNIVQGSLLPSEYANYAAYLNSFTDYMAANSAPVDVVSLQNEADFAATYESCLWTAAQFDTFCSQNAGAIKVPVMMPESFHYDQTLSNAALNDPAAAANIKYVGGHLYGATIADYPLAHSLGKHTWMTEYLVNDQTISSAIDTGQQISDCLTTGNMSAYIWWKTIGNANGLLDANGVLQPRAYVMAQFSRFVRPGDVRIGVSANSSPLGISAFRSTDRGAVAIVAVNSTSTAINQVFNLQGISTPSVTPVMTSATQSLQPQPAVNVSGNAFTYTIPAKSIVTFVAPIAPAAPTALSATVASITEVDLAWTGNSAAESYTVLRANTTGGPYAAVASSVTGTSFNDTTAAPSTTYYYVVQAVNAAGTSPSSNEASATTPPPPPQMSSAATASGTYGTAFTFVVTATSAPTSFGAAGLPSGLSIDPASGVISGTPLAAGTYAVTLSATNAGGTGTAPLTLTIAPAVPHVSVVPYSVSYDGNNHAAAGSATGVFGETLTGLDVSATTHANAGTYHDGWTFVDASGNYQTATGTVTDLIGQASATLVVSGYSVTYDGTAHTATGTATGVTGAPLAGLDVSATTHTTAGTYTDSWVFADATGNYQSTSGSVTDAISKADASIVLAPLTQAYDGTPKPVTATTNPGGLTVNITYDGAAAAPSSPGAHSIVAAIDDPNYEGTVTTTLQIGVTALVNHAPTLNGELDGSAQVLLPESTTLNGNALVSGDLLVPGSPSVTLNGHPTYAGTTDGTGASTPSNYSVTLNGSAVLRHVVRRTDAIALPTVGAPPASAGVRNVVLNSAGETVDDWGTARDLTLNGNAGQVTVPAGTYGTFLVNGGSGLTLGVAGATEPAVYNLQALTVNGNARLDVVGPVIIHLANGITVNGSVGAIDHPEWLTIEIASGGVTLNGSGTLGGSVTAPHGTVTLDGSARLYGSIVADRLTLNGNAMLRDVSR